MNVQKKPTLKGQICKLSNPRSDENTRELFIILDAPHQCSDDEIIYVISVSDFIRKETSLNSPKLKAVLTSELQVVHENIEQFYETRFVEYPVSVEKIPTFVKYNHTFYSIMDATLAELEIFFSDVTREELIIWLSWNDRNGVYKDEESMKEFDRIITKPEGIEYMKEQILSNR